MKRCSVCRGQKRVCRLGGVIVDCEECKAVGFIDAKIVMNEPVEAAKDEVKEIVKTKAVVKNKGKVRKVKK